MGLLSTSSTIITLHSTSCPETHRLVLAIGIVLEQKKRHRMRSNWHDLIAAIALSALLRASCLRLEIDLDK